MREQDRRIPPRGGSSSAQPKKTKTLANQVDDLACRCMAMEGVAGEMLATLKLNFERGHLIVQSDEGKLNFARMIAAWERIESSWPRS